MNCCLFYICCSNNKKKTFATLGEEILAIFFFHICILSSIYIGKVELDEFEKTDQKTDEAHDENKLKKLGESDKKRVREWSTSLKREFDDQTALREEYQKQLKNMNKDSMKYHFLRLKLNNCEKSAVLFYQISCMIASFRSHVFNYTTNTLIFKLF